MPVYAKKPTAPTTFVTLDGIIDWDGENNVQETRKIIEIVVHLRKREHTVVLSGWPECDLHEYSLSKSISTGDFLTIKLLKASSVAKIQLTWYESSTHYMLRVEGEWIQDIGETWDLDEEITITLKNAILYEKLPPRLCKGATNNLVELHSWSSLDHNLMLSISSDT
jgi:hypothetical protein